ncbi:lanthionine synthetase C family protein [Thermobifida halotolerans]|uniref:Lanthionine synthetase C family protein n=1 Tax=Thermobifida halotolerans TaxID=483545 RepID=A0AA97M0H3_9ACTN|nr:lanthionine synthetase C family protein [Thermobifida halotolerans]UOE21376.1 lanthionine synthetase C family protein [Thermobifida halotolerans]
MTHGLPLVPKRGLDPAQRQSLAFGTPGTALLHIVRACTSAGDWDTAHQWVTSVTRGPVAAHTDASLFHGAPAVAFMLRIAAKRSYTTALATLDDHITALTRTRLDQAHARISRGELPRLGEYDLISGLTGIGVCLFQAQNTDLLREVLAYLVRLTATVTVEGRCLPGWWTLHGPSGRLDPRWPGGHANLGLAHGISGPLALLAQTMIHGITVPGQTRAIADINRVLDRWLRGLPHRPWWPGTVSAREWESKTLHQTGPQRPSWCYGTPGLARAQQLAALALSNPERQHTAETVLASCITDEAQLDQLRDDSLCHGWAGLVHTSRRAAEDAPHGSALVLAFSRLQDLWRHRRPYLPALPDHGGLLEGTVGAILAHHSVEHPVSPSLPASWWDACLLTTAPVKTTDLEGTR